MYTAHDIQKVLASIGTAERPVSVWRHLTLLLVTLVFIVAITTVDLYCSVCETTPGSIFLASSMVLAAGFGAAFLLYGLVQYFRHRNR